VPVDGSNLVLRAAEAFAAATGWGEPVHFCLTKRIPPGAGLGGGSSNAVAALRALNQLSGGLLDASRLGEVAAKLGSDCALFLANAAVVMRGRGDRVEPLPDPVARLRGRRVLLFKPSFGISTPWAYQRMVARGRDYLPMAEAENRLWGWLGGAGPAEGLLFNNMEPAAFEKYIALPLLLEKLRGECGVVARMSGSGSACYALLGDDQVADPLVVRIRACWGAGAFVRESRISWQVPEPSR
jgi:4-diphosphocytidyl-2-C-methyl-D-erythritol kinase